METITPTIGTQSNFPTTSVSQPGGGEEFNSFLKLLTAQIQNQDPLEPLDSTQFVEQLATFSSLEQQVNTNSTLEFIASVMTDLQTTLAGDWLGQTVSIESSFVPYTGREIQFNADIPADTDRAVLSIRDTHGDVLWTETLDPDAGVFKWNGQTQTGEPVASDSLLNFSIDIYHEGNYAGALAPRIITTVTAIGQENGQLRLGTSSSLTTDLVNIRKVDE